MQIYIPSSGYGKRLAPLTDFTHKALLPIEGKPALERIIKSFKEAGFDDFVISVQHKGEQIQQYLEQNRNFGVKIKVTHFKGEKKRGMSAALEEAESEIKEPFIMTSCDTVFPVKYLRDFTKYFKQKKCDALLSLSDLGQPDFLVGKSVAGFDRGTGNVSKILEKPELEEVFSTFVSTPLYGFSPAVFSYLPRVPLSKRGEYELQDAIQLMIDDNSNVKGFLNKEWNSLKNWKMLNNGRDLLLLNFDYFKKILGGIK